MIEFMGKQLENPLIASSCIATENVSNVLWLAENGVQGAILKSCADYERCLLYTSPSPRDRQKSRMPSSA